MDEVRGKKKGKDPSKVNLQVQIQTSSVASAQLPQEIDRYKQKS